MKVTQKELYIIEAIISNEMSANNYFLPHYSLSFEQINTCGGCWSDTIEQNGAKHGEKVAGKNISGVVGSLNKKGFVISSGGRSLEATVEVTKAGWEAYQEAMKEMEGMG